MLEMPVMQMIRRLGMVLKLLRMLEAILL